MKHTIFFEYNIPADNEFSGRTNSYVNVIAEWNGKDTYYDGRPMVSLIPVTHHFADLIIVKDWYQAKCDIERLAQEHFAEIAKAERINQAREILGKEENPILERLGNAREIGTIMITESGKAIAL